MEVEKPVRDGQGGHLPEDDIVAQRIAQPFDGERGPTGAVSEFVVPLVDVAAEVAGVDGDDGFVGVSVPQRAHGEHEDFVVVAGEDRVSGRNVGERGGDFTKDGPVLAQADGGKIPDGEAGDGHERDDHDESGGQSAEGLHAVGTAASSFVRVPG